MLLRSSVWKGYSRGCSIVSIVLAWKPLIHTTRDVPRSSQLLHVSLANSLFAYIYTAVNIVGFIASGVIISECMQCYDPLYISNALMTLFFVVILIIRTYAIWSRERYIFITLCISSSVSSGALLGQQRIWALTLREQITFVPALVVTELEVKSLKCRCFRYLAHPINLFIHTKIYQTTRGAVLLDMPALLSFLPTFSLHSRRQVSSIRITLKNWNPHSFQAIAVLTGIKAYRHGTFLNFATTNELKEFVHSTTFTRRLDFPNVQRWWVNLSLEVYCNWRWTVRTLLLCVSLRLAPNIYTW